MKLKTPTVGTICISTKGRDKGNIYAVQTVIDERFVLAVDGIRAKLDSPKRKNIKHLYLTPHNSAQYGADFSDGKVNDCTLAYAIKQYKNSQN